MYDIYIYIYSFPFSISKIYRQTLNSVGLHIMEGLEPASSNLSQSEPSKHPDILHSHFISHQPFFKK